MNILNEMIEDKNLVWDKSLNNQIEKFQVNLDTKSINELIENRENLTNFAKNIKKRQISAI